MWNVTVNGKKTVTVLPCFSTTSLTAQRKQVAGRNPPHFLIPDRDRQHRGSKLLDDILLIVSSCWGWSQHHDGDGRGRNPRSCVYISNAQPRNDQDIFIVELVVLGTSGKTTPWQIPTYTGISRDKPTCDLSRIKLVWDMQR